MRRCAVATPHPAATAAAREILQRGGNAIDAAVGAMLACCVATPGAVGLGGYGGSLVAYLASGGQAVAVDFDSRAPQAYRSELFRSQPQRYEQGHLSITVPAVVAGLELALNRFGTLSWAVVSEPAIVLAERGLPVTAILKQQLDEWARKADPISQRALFPAGTVPQVGTTWQQSDMARLLRRLSQQGPREFYQGDIPQMIVRQVRSGGGILAEEDFERYQPEVVEPLATDYRGNRVLTPPPPSGGLTSLQILKVLEQFELSNLEPWGAEYFHLFAEAAKQSWQDRAAYFGDPDISAIPIDRLLSDEAAREKAARIHQGKVLRFPVGTSPSPPHTANIVAADGDGNVVSVTATQGYLYGSTVVIEGLGLVMGHGMSRFDLAEGSPNVPAAGKRMFHNMAPVVLLGADGRPWAALGLPGGPKIVTVTAQLVVSLVDFKVAPIAAVSAPRVHVEADEPIAASATVPQRVIEELEAIGHTVSRGQNVGGLPDEIGGKANAIVIDPATQDMLAASQAGETAAVTIDMTS
jgi:gamma-glutamyltranspeptidase / glutathione hydrolase